jgi:acyl-CoA hydrolase
MSLQTLYLSKRTTAHEAIRRVRDGETIVVPTGVGEPPALLAALSERRRDFRDVKILQLLGLQKFDYLDPETVEHVRPLALFFSATTRPGAEQRWIDFIPNSFGEIPAMISRRQIPAHAVFALASPMDENGNFALGLGADYTHAATRVAPTVILEVNPNVPFAFGNCHVHISQVTAVVEDTRPIFEVPAPAVGPIEEAIAAHVGELVEEGATLQIGYGSIPDAVARQLQHKHDLGIHTELFGSGILDLIESGAVTNRRKNYLPGKMVASFALGNRRVYRFFDRNPQMEMHPVDFTNDPYLAGRNDNLVAINASLQVDLLGQCGSESFGSTPYSGSGGQLDFMRAANRSEGGKGIIVLPATARGGTVSRIVPELPAGTHVTTGKNDVNYVVTEFGIAQLRGKSASQRARALIAIAHPDFRAALVAAAKRIVCW